VHARAGSVEELYAELLLESADLFGERRLRQVQQVCSPGEAADLSGRDEGPKACEIDVRHACQLCAL
jgi:hypothetical protein